MHHISITHARTHVHTCKTLKIIHMLLVCTQLDFLTSYTGPRPITIHGLSVNVSTIGRVSDFQWNFTLEWEVLPMPDLSCDFKYIITDNQTGTETVTSCLTPRHKFTIEDEQPHKYTVTTQNCMWRSKKQRIM